MSKAASNIPREIAVSGDEGGAAPLGAFPADPQNDRHESRATAVEDSHARYEHEANPPQEGAAWPALHEDWGDEDESQSPQRQKGTFLEERLDLRDPEGHRLTRRVMVEIEAVEGHRKKIRSEWEEQHHYLLLRKLLANGFRCFNHRQPWEVAYFRKADKYKDKPESWLNGRALSRTVEALEKAGLVRANTGGRKGRLEDISASTYSVGITLSDIFQEMGLSDSSLKWPVAREQLVRLKTREKKPSDIVFLPTTETERWRDEMEGLNRYLGQQEICHRLSFEQEQQWVAQKNARPGRGGMPLYRPEMFRTELYRSFSATFEQGGRLYGGWWMECPKWVRPYITINGRKTVELDFSAYHPRMLYHQRLIEYLDDPYVLEPVAAYERENGLPEEHYRDTLKQLFNAIINAERGSRPANIIYAYELSHPPIFAARDLRVMLEKKHHRIQDAFCTGVGLRLQRLDSDIALDILNRLMVKGIPALPVHDSFIVTEDHEEALREAMVGAYKQVFNFDPIVEKKTWDEVRLKNVPQPNSSHQSRKHDNLTEGYDD